MKTTVEIEDDLLRAAKRAALDRGLTLRQVIEQALRRDLSAPRGKPLKLVTVPGRAPEWVANREKMWEWFDRSDAGE